MAGETVITVVGNLVEARTCGMHDHLRPLATSLQLRITIR